MMSELVSECCAEPGTRAGNKAEDCACAEQSSQPARSLGKKGGQPTLGKLGGAERSKIAHKKGERRRSRCSRRGSKPRLTNAFLPLPMAQATHRRLGGAGQQWHRCARLSSPISPACTVLIAAAASVVALLARSCPPVRR